MSKYFKSLLELVFLVYAADFLGSLVADGVDIWTVGAWKAAAAAGVSPVLVLLYALVVKARGNPDSALAVDTRSDL